MVEVKVNPGTISTGYEGDVTADKVKCDRFPQWTFAVTLEPPGNITRLEIHAPKGMTARQLQEVPLGAIRDAVAHKAAKEVRHDAGLIRGGGLGHFVAVAEAVENAPSGGRDDTWYAANVAYPYATAPLPQRRSRAVAEHLERLGEHVSAGTVRGYVHECRPGRRGLLTKAQRGKSVGELTAKAKRLLAKLDQQEN